MLSLDKDILSDLKRISSGDGAGRYASPPHKDVAVEELVCGRLELYLKRGLAQRVSNARRDKLQKQAISCLIC